MERSAPANGLVLVALLLAGAQFSNAQPPSLEIERVYRTVLADARCSGRGQPGSRGSVPVIRRELVLPARQSWWTSPGTAPSFADRARTLLPSSLVDELSRAGGDRTILSEATAQALGAVTIAQSDVDALAKESDYWAAFFRKFPSASAAVQLSPVAFDGPAREALVYCGYSTNPLGGEGFIVHLRLTGGTWTAVAWHQVWIS